MNRNFMDMLRKQWDKGKFVCVGLDSEWEKVQGYFVGNNDMAYMWKSFNQDIVKATKDIACVYKINTAFYEAQGCTGWDVLAYTIQVILSYTEVPVILDAKRGDIGNTNNGYVKMAFENLGADAITVHPYLGMEAMKPFLDCKDKGIFVLCKTSNKGSDEFQDLCIGDEHAAGFGTQKIYQRVAQNVARNSKWNYNENCGLVVGATYPEELKTVRDLVGNDVPILIPGVGAQGGDLEAAVKNGKNSCNCGFLVNSSRGIIFAGKGADYADSARKAAEDLHKAIQKAI
jgi:orotidine-5'-phosphate decarboxylase